MKRSRWRMAAALLLGVLPAAAGCSAQETAAGRGLTAVEGLAVGHHTLVERPTGCTVVLAEGGAVGGVDVRGGSPGTAETDLLDPVNAVDKVHAIVLAGGSAFGLAAREGVVRYLEEKGVGYAFGGAIVPIVPGAILFDLGVGGDPSIRPGAECGYRAAAAASTAAPEEGSVGAGAGATVGKMRGMGRAMKGGVGTASITLDDGLTVAAIVAVNAAGDIIDPSTGRVVAGVRDEAGTGLADARRLLRERAVEAGAGANTTIAVVATNAALTKAEATKMAQMAQDGFARAIYPSHTPGDGDTIFSLATGAWDGEPSVGLIGALAADVVSEAILRAVRHARGLPGLPSVSELGDGS